MYINKFVFVYILLIFIYFFNVSVEWIGDNMNVYYLDEVISELYVGQIDISFYFCIKMVKVNGSGILVVVCVVLKQSIWVFFFKEFFDQVRYFYSIG